MTLSPYAAAVPSVSVSVFPSRETSVGVCAAPPAPDTVNALAGGNSDSHSSLSSKTRVSVVPFTEALSTTGPVVSLVMFQTLWFVKPATALPMKSCSGPSFSRPGGGFTSRSGTV